MLLLSCALLLIVSNISLSNADTPEETEFGIKPDSRHGKMLRHLNDKLQRYPSTHLYDVKIRRLVGLDRIFAFDEKPLGKRIPVILIPGRAEEFQPSSWWNKLDRVTRESRRFMRDYKLYVYIYNSELPLAVQATHFNRDMEYMFGTLPASQKTILITYSLGGMIALRALENGHVQERVHTMFAIAVPFHGSPMFDPSYFIQYYRSPNRSPIRTFWDRFIYRAYLFDKTNLLEGLRWDNFDGSLPQFDSGHLNLHGDMALLQQPPFEESPAMAQLKKKTIVYASYLKNGYIKDNEPVKKKRSPWYVLEASASIPKKIIGTVLPFYGLSVHAVFTYMNYQLANLPTFTPENPEGLNTHLYRYNDGVIPLSSMLWLPQRDQPYDEALEQLIAIASVKKVRVFPTIDHTHIGDYGIQSSRLEAIDVAHPTEGKRQANRWLLSDVLGMRSEFSAWLDSAKTSYPKMSNSPLNHPIISTPEAAAEVKQQPLQQKLSPGAAKN